MFHFIVPQSFRHKVHHLFRYIQFGNIIENFAVLRDERPYSEHYLYNEKTIC